MYDSHHPSFKPITVDLNFLLTIMDYVLQESIMDFFPFSRYTKWDAMLSDFSQFVAWWIDIISTIILWLVHVQCDFNKYVFGELAESCYVLDFLLKIKNIKQLGTIMFNMAVCLTK